MFRRVIAKTANNVSQGTFFNKAYIKNKSILIMAASAASVLPECRRKPCIRVSTATRGLSASGPIINMLLKLIPLQKIPKKKHYGCRTVITSLTYILLPSHYYPRPSGIFNILLRNNDLTYIVILRNLIHYIEHIFFKYCP